MRTITCDMCGDSRDEYTDRWRVDKYMEVYFNHKNYDFCPKCAPKRDKFIEVDNARRSNKTI